MVFCQGSIPRYLSRCRVASSIWGSLYHVDRPFAKASDRNTAVNPDRNRVSCPGYRSLPHSLDSGRARDIHLVSKTPGFWRSSRLLDFDHSPCYTFAWEESREGVHPRFVVHPAQIARRRPNHRSYQDPRPVVGLYRGPMAIPDLRRSSVGDSEQR